MGNISDVTQKIIDDISAKSTEQPNLNPQHTLQVPSRPVRIAENQLNIGTNQQDNINSTPNGVSEAFLLGTQSTSPVAASEADGGKIDTSSDSGDEDSLNSSAVSSRSTSPVSSELNADGEKIDTSSARGNEDSLNSSAVSLRSTSPVAQVRRRRKNRYQQRWIIAKP